MSQPTIAKPRFQFVTQLPRDDGCGVVVLQMLTGKSYEQIAGMIDWGAHTNHYTTWSELRDVLTELGWQFGDVRPADRWSDVEGLAIVHVQQDHFMLFDNGVFYDPGQLDGPAMNSSCVPIGYMPVRPPQASVQR